MWPDRDKTGQQHANEVANSLDKSGMVESVRMVEPLDELEERGDVADGVSKLRWTREDILNILEKSQHWTPEPFIESSQERSDVPDSIYSNGTSERKINLEIRSAATLIQYAPEVKWQIEGILPESSALVVVADAGVGKTWLVLAN